MGGGPAMPTRMTGDEWGLVLDLWRRAGRSRRGDEGRDDRRFLEAPHDFSSVRDITWRALPAGFGHRSGAWERSRRPSRAGVFEASFETSIASGGRTRRARARSASAASGAVYGSRAMPGEIRA